MDNPVAAFERSVLEAFGDVAVEFGFSTYRLSFHMPEMSVTWRTATTGVQVVYELGAAPWVVLWELEPADGSQAGSRTSLELLLEERSPGNEALRCQAGDPGSLPFRVCLDAKAKAVRSLAADVLRGDFRVFRSLEARAAENRRRRNLELFGSPDE